MRSELLRGKQIYAVYPLIEESEKVDLKNATDMSRELAKVFEPEFNVALLHGRMSGDQKEAIMSDFKANKIPILVATSVVEVGVDVPNASVMVIEHAERFGLSQLHQLRGRVGRSSHQSYCILMADYKRSEDAQGGLPLWLRQQMASKLRRKIWHFAGRGNLSALGNQACRLFEWRIWHETSEFFRRREKQHLRSLIRTRNLPCLNIRCSKRFFSCDGPVNLIWLR
jgi:ATP-dependent DNA helicase RecG